MIIHDVQQGAEAWNQLRAGKPTASMFDSIITPGGKKGKPAASSARDAYMNHLLAERIFGTYIDGFKSQFMARGNQFEDRAVASYELSQGVETERIGFVTTDDGLIGCSPDRFIIRDGPRRLLECKAPTLPNHVGYLRAATGALGPYKAQLMGQMWVCEAEAVDIISYHPDAPDALFTVERDEEFITEMAAHVRAFSRELEEITEDFKARGWIKPRKPEESHEGNPWMTQSDVDWAVRHAAGTREA